MWVGGFGFGGEGWRWKTPVWQSCLFVDLQPLCPDARWYTRTILGPDVRQRLLMGAVCPWGACGGQGSSCAKPHSLTNSVQVRRKRTGANILRAPPRRSAKLQQCGPTFETVLHGGHAVRGVYAPVTLDAISLCPLDSRLLGNDGGGMEGVGWEREGQGVFPSPGWWGKGEPEPMDEEMAAFA